MKRKQTDFTLDYLAKFAFVIVISPILMALLYHVTNLNFSKFSFLTSEATPNKEINK